MKPTRVAALIFTSLLCNAMPALAQSGLTQPFPVKTVRLITSEAGGSSDLIARFIAQAIAGPLGQQVIVENRGGSLVIQVQTLMSAPADGHTLLIGTGSLWVQALLEKVPYDPVADFAPVTIITKAPNVLVVHPSLPVKTVTQLIALAKAKPGELNYASGITGSSLEIAGELFKAMAGVNIVRIPFKGMAPGLVSTMGGQMQLMFPTAISVPPLIKSGKLRALAVTSLQAFPLLPDLPTVAAILPGYESGTTLGLFAPAKTPAAAIQKLNEEIVRFLRTAEAKERFLAVGGLVVGSTQEEFAAHRKTDMARINKLIKESGLRAE